MNTNQALKHNQQLPERFWRKVSVSENSCWEWLAYRQPCGYGLFRSEGNMKLAHRIAYEWLIGEIPEGLQLDHLCRNRGCVNPAHLEPVTTAENVARGFAARGILDHCKRGHELSNSYIDKRGVRHCRECNNIASAKYRRRVGRVSGLGQGYRSDLEPSEYRPSVET